MKSTAEMGLGPAAHQPVLKCMKALICFILFFSCQVSAEEPAIEALLSDSPVIVVATPVFENGRPPLGIGSEVVLVKYSVKFRVLKVLKSNQELKAGDLILTRLAVHLEGPGRIPSSSRRACPRYFSFERPATRRTRLKTPASGLV